MSQFINNIRDTFCNFVKLTFSFDRSNQIFGKTMADQLKGRDKQVKLSLIGGIFYTALLGLTLSQAIMHPGLVNYFAVGIAGAGTLILLKEAAIQSVARSREKQIMELQLEETIEEDEYTRYSINDYITELKQGMKNIREKICGTNSSSTTPEPRELGEIKD